MKYAISVIFAAFASAQGMNSAGMSLMNMASGTAVNPDAAPMDMIMSNLGSWNTMLMGSGFISDIQQSGPRGGDKLYSTNMFMVSAQHALGDSDSFRMELMLSLEPATITDRRYPLLFQTGETAFGNPIVDGQHPHNFIMALGFHYAHAVSENTTVDFYFAPVGDPALGPIAYPHRASAAELPEAPISHHWQDSTHISDEVITAGLSHKQFRVEASGFYGSEPGENRWTIEGGPINSWSARVWYFPSAHWAAQVSVGRITKPEALEPGDQVRSTASVEYSKDGWSSSLIWGRNHDTATQHDLNSYLVESVLPIRQKNFLTGRIEVVDKDELIVPGIYRIGEYTIGYTRDVPLIPRIETGLGFNFSSYSLPGSIKSAYGDRPVGGNMFIRFRVRGRV